MAPLASAVVMVAALRRRHAALMLRNAGNACRLRENCDEIGRGACCFGRRGGGGRRGVVVARVGAGELVEVIRSVARGEAYVSPALAARLLADGRRGDRAGDGAADLVAGLTAREEQILRCVARGLSNKEVGRELDLQEKTVKHYMTNILQKLQVRNRVEAALVARDAFHRPDDGRVGGPTKV
jgi:DNA-binding CsgD family transcriptional regulator